jgi:hypothetical protein
MGNTFAILALRRKRAHLAGDIARAEEALARLRDGLADLDAVILQFEPDATPEAIRPVRRIHRCTIFRHGEMLRLARSALRNAAGPISARAVMEYALAAKGLPSAEAPRGILASFRIVLGRLERKGSARRVADGKLWEATPFQQ